MSASILEQITALGAASAKGKKTQITLLESLRSLLQQQAQAINAATEQIELTLFDDPFSLLAALCPLLRHSDAPIAVQDCLGLVAKHSSARELVLAMGERFIVLCPLDYPDYSDSEEDGDEEYNDPGDEEWEAEGAVREFVVLVNLHTIVLPRLQTEKPLKFLGPILDSMVTSVETLADTGAFPSPSNETSIELLSLEDTYDSALEVVDAVVKFVDAILDEGIWISIEKEKATEGLRNLLLSTIAVLHKSLSANIAERFFYDAYPRYRIPGRSSTTREAISTAWKSIIATARTLGLNINALCALALPSASATSQPGINTGAFTLLTHLLSASPNLTPSHLYSTASASSTSDLLSRMLPNLIAAFGSDGRAGAVGEDEGLFFVWWCVQDELKAGGEVDDTVLFTLVELLSTLSALSPSTSTRFLAFKLLSTLIVKGTQKEEIQFMIIKGLLRECPFDGMKVASIGILKELLMLYLGAEAEKSVFASPTLLEELKTTTLRFDPVDLLDPSNEDSETTTMEIFLDAHYKPTIEKLGFLYFLLARDAKNETTIRSAGVVDSTRRHFLDPLRSSLDTWIAVFDAKTPASKHHSGANLHDIASSANDGSPASTGRMRVECEMLSGALDRVTDFLASNNDFR